MPINMTKQQSQEAEYFKEMVCKTDRTKFKFKTRRFNLEMYLFGYWRYKADCRAWQAFTTEPTQKLLYWPSHDFYTHFQY